MPIDAAIEFFKSRGQDYKVELLEDLKRFGTTKISAEEAQDLPAMQGQALQAGVGEKSDVASIYWTGKFVDLCRGPHVKNTLELQAFKLLKVAGAYWRGKEGNPQLVRLYGTAFPTQAELDEYLHLQEEIAKRDHRKLGADMGLFSFHDIAPGAAFFHPKGMIVIRELESFIRGLQKDRGYLETRTPILVKEDLYGISGHLSHYKENLFSFEIDDKERLSLKPMNCPESTYIYRLEVQSYKDLPLRLSEFGSLHRRERSGTLMGLFRVYGFTQDDAHIYASMDQIQGEIKNVLALIKTIHKTFGLKTLYAFATRPDKAIGDPSVWLKAEAALKLALEANKLEYDLHPKDGAFYGPKIDIEVEDSLKRRWTIATIQLDFQMPERFDLTFTNSAGAKERPVMIHRSSIGSFERFLGLLLEHTGGNLPVWLTPVQVQIIPVGSHHEKPSAKLSKELAEAGIRTYLDDARETVGYKIRKAERQKVPYMLVVGDKEAKGRNLTVRIRGKAKTVTLTRKKFVERVTAEIAKRK
jgi:threonyl-tRNA synthetase